MVMNRKVVALVLAAAMLGMTGCGVSQDDYDAAVFAQESAEQELSTSKSDYSSLESTYNSLSDDYASLESTYEELSDSYSSLKDEYDAYKEKMQPYEELDKAEAEAREAKAKQEKAEAEAAEKKKKEEEAAAKKKKEEEEAAAAESKEKMGYDTGITYDNLARNPDDYEGEKVKFYGKVLQVIEGDGTVQIRLAVNDDYDTVLLGEYDSSIVTSRVLEDDEITIYGTSAGLISYESTMGGTITIPAVLIDKIDQ